MTEAAHPRPRQVTLAAGVLMVASAFLVLFAFDTIAGLGSIEAQQSAEDFVNEPGNRELGLTPEGVQTLLRIMCVVAGGAATAAVFLGWQVLQRRASARLALSVLAPVILVAGFPAAQLLAMLVAGAVVILWTQPARDWLAGRAPAPRPEPAPRRAPASTPTPAPPATGARLPDYAPPPGAPAAPVGATYAPPSTSAPAVVARPQALVTACVVTIVSSVLTAIVTAVILVVMLTDRQAFEAEIAKELADNQAYADAGLDVDVLMGVLIAMLAAFVVWALVAVVLAAFALRGSNGARIALIVSAVASAAASVIGILAVVPLLVGVTAVGATVLLTRREVAAWCRRS